MTESFCAPHPHLLLVDATMNTDDRPVADELQELFQVQVVTLPYLTEEVICRAAPHAILFDFDYLEQDMLCTVRDTKKDWPGIPLLMMTLQHSEHLAVWALRARLWDYYVKPLNRNDYIRMQSSLTTLRGLPHETRQQRTAVDKQPRVPVDARFLPSQPTAKLALAVIYVQTHLHEGVNSSVVTELTGMSFECFSRQFSQHYGINFQAFVTQKRMEEAERLIANPHMSIADVAFAVGYNDTSYFSRIFRKQHNATPSEFRKGINDSVEPAVVEPQRSVSALNRR